MPATIMDNHLKNVEKASAGGKFNPNFGLANSGIAGTGNDKDDEEGKEGGASASAGGSDEEMKDLSKKDGKPKPLEIGKGGLWMLVKGKVAKSSEFSFNRF